MKNNLKINSELVEKTLIKFLNNEIKKFGFKKGILGLSGGLDSSVTAFLGAKALSSKNLIGLILPYKTSDKKNIDDAVKIAKDLKIEYHKIDITPQIDIYFKDNPTESKLIVANKIARERMSVIFDYSSREKAIVMGTSNKTELLLGYGTWYGDLAFAIDPLGDLYKTQVRQLAKHLNVPDKILEKVPSADLWEGQTDEKELGIKYSNADEILYLLVDKRRSPEELIKEGYQKKQIKKLLGLIKKYQFKRSLPVIAKLSHRTIGKDFLYPRDWGV